LLGDPAVPGGRSAGLAAAGIQAEIANEPVSRREALDITDRRLSVAAVRVDGREGVGALVDIRSDHNHPARPFDQWVR